MQSATRTPRVDSIKRRAPAVAKTAKTAKAAKTAKTTKAAKTTQSNLLRGRLKGQIAAKATTPTGAVRKGAPRGKQALLDYLALAAHEFRSPLSSLIGFSGLLLNFEFDELTRRDFLLSIQSQSERLNRLVDDLVDLAKIEVQGVAMLRGTEADLSAVVHTAVEAFGQANAAAHLDEYLSTGLPRVKCDVSLVGRMVTHLLDNAVKFSAADSCIRISTLLIGEDGRPRPGIRIEDAGAGIALQDQAHLGEKFFRGAVSVTGKGSGSGSGNGNGNGLGLALVKAIIGIHGGTLDIDSVQNRGTTVTLGFPASASRKVKARP